MSGVSAWLATKRILHEAKIADETIHCVPAHIVSIHDGKHAVGIQGVMLIAPAQVASITDSNNLSMFFRPPPQLVETVIKV